MRVQATKTMANALNKHAKATNCPYRFAHFTTSYDAYRYGVDSDVFGAFDYGDYNSATGEFRAIEVIYPSEYYACPQYLTTKRLNKLFVTGDTLESFIDRIIEDVAI